MRITNKDLSFNSVDLSASCTSESVDVRHVSQFAVQVVTSGTHAGTLKVQVSCDETAPTNWSDLPSATAAVTNSGAYLINVVDAGYSHVRVVYTFTSGTGSITSARINTKGI